MAIVLPHVSVANGGDESFHVQFDEHPDGTDGDTPYFLMQRQFESPYGGRVYIESHERALCGFMRVRRAVLTADVLRLELVVRPPPQEVAIRFHAEGKGWDELADTLRIIVGSRALQLRLE